MSFDPSDIDRLKGQTDLVAVIGSRVQLTHRGREYVGLCPFHDESTPSFCVIPEKGFAHCFGCDWNGDAIAFLMEHDGLDFKTALETLGGQDWQALPMKAGLAPRASRLPWVTSLPPSNQEAPASFSTPALGDPTAIWTYRNAGGAVLGYVARYEAEAEGQRRKVILQWTYGQKGAEPLTWQCKHFSRPRPLYGLDRLAAKPSAQVLIVEGEKTCDAATQLFPDHVAVTWPGGAQAMPHVDWAPLYGRQVVVIPDADEPGREASRYICALLAENKCTVKWINPEPDRPKGWDLADGLVDNWTPSVALKWAKERIRPYDPTASVQQGQPDSQNSPRSDDHAEAKAARRKTLKKGPLSLVNDEHPASPPSDPAPPAFSDDHLAALFVAQNGLDWRFVAEWNKWYRWDGVAWREDSTLEIFSLARHLCRGVVNFEQGALLNEGQKRAITSSRTHASLARVASYDRTVAATVSQWDTDPWLLSTPGGVVDLTTGEVRGARREDYQTKSTGVPPHGECPLWLSFLDTVTAGNTELQAYLQRLAGYCLTGVTTEQVLAFFYGTGGNGKGVFLRTLRTILGDYGCTASIDTFTESKGERHETELAMLRGARFVTAQETDDGRKWAEAKIKTLTGGDPIRARFMRQDYFEFQPAFKLIFAGNHKPGLRSVDEAMRRRVHIVPWTVTIPKDQRDPLLEEKLRHEFPGILRWMIDGCLLWLQTGLNPPAAVTEATDEYLESEDALAAWLDESCEIGVMKEVSSSLLYNNYVEYCERTKEHPWSQKRLVQNLIGRGMERGKLGGQRTIKGLDLKLAY